MNVLVIPDIHLKPWIFDKAEEILKAGKADKAVCLMDIPDDWGMELKTNKYEETLEVAYNFALKHPDSLWCWGNHDVSYLWGKLESGYSPYAEEIVEYGFEGFEDALTAPSQLAFIHRIDKVLFMHGGLTESFILNYLGEKYLQYDIDDVIKAINDLGPDALWHDDSPLWLRPQSGYHAIFRKDEYKQVVGHTPVTEIYEKEGVISTDVFSTYPNGQQIGESAMIVIETTTGEFEKLPITQF